MAQIKLLSNQTRAILRPPFLVKMATAGLLANLLPVIKKPAQKAFDSRDRAPKKAAGPVQAAANPEKSPPAASTPTKPQSALNQDTSAKPRPSFQPPRAPSLRVPGTGAPVPGRTTPEPERPVSNGKVNHPRPGISGGNGTSKNGVPHNSQLFHPENYSTARTNRPADRDRFRTNHTLPGQPLPNLPLSQRSGANPVAQNNRTTGLESSTPARSTQQPADILENLRRLFEEHDDLPAQSVILGVGSDGFPILLDLNDPTAGAVVIIGDEREEQINLLRTLVASVAMRNSPRSVQILIVTVEPQPWNEWVNAQGYERFCLGIEGVDDVDALRDWILRLGDWTEQRRLGQRSGPPVLVVMDTLSFMPRLAYDVRLNFEWMAKEGPPAQIWPVAAISTELAQLLNSRRMLRAFQTRILGYAADPSFYVQMAGLSEQEAAGFIRPGRFTLRLGENWLEFNLPGRA